MLNKIKWKRRYEYECKGCEQQRFTVFKYRAKRRVCAKCRREKSQQKLMENQRTIFDSIEEKKEVICP